jgi:predicted CXXCH cytochrome family protein
MHRKAFILAAGIAAVCVFLVMIALYTAAEDPGEGTRSPADYVGIEECKGCHPDEYAEWQTTFHGINFTNWDYHGVPTNKYTLYGGSCLPCHVVGYNETAIGGYDPNEEWNSTRNIGLLGIQCEVCHGPGSDHPGANPAGTINLDRDPYAGACGGTEEAGCHGEDAQFGNETVHGWNASAHAPWDNRAQAEPHGLNTYCASCKSPSQWDPSATYMNNVEISKDEWRGITCADCHDVHTATANEHQLRWSQEEICGSCHTSDGATSPDKPHQPQIEMREGHDASETGAPFMGTVTCVDCHMYQSGHDWEPVFQGHSFEPTPQACWSCHQTGGIPPELTNTTSQTEIDDWQDDVEDLLLELEPKLTDAEYEITKASGNGTASAYTLKIAQDLFDNASFNYHFVEEDRSHGVHNYYYAMEILEAAIEDAETAVAILEAPDVITGLNAQDARDGKVDVSWSASSASDFAYYNVYASIPAITDARDLTPVGTVFDMGTTSYEVAGLEDGTEYNFAVTAVDMDGNEIPTGLSTVSATPTATAAISAEGIPIWMWAVVGVLAALVVVGFVMAAMARRGSIEEEEIIQPPRTEE